MALVATQAVSVGTTAVHLNTTPSDQFGARVLVVAQGSGTLVLGPSGVTAANGVRIPVVAGTVISIDLETNDELYGIVSSGSLAVDVLMVGL